jgi:predicted GNAT superfamily acetyltransferase
LIESYISLASSKTFSVDPVVTGIRSLNSIGSLIEGKIDYVLEDGSSVAIDKDTQEILNSLLEDKYQLVEYMRESKQNFAHVVRELS